MGAPAGRKLVGGYVEEALAERFHAWARTHEGGASSALRRLIQEAVGDAEAQDVKGPGIGRQVGVRFRPAERALLAEAARAHGTTPANWLRSLALVHLTRRPQWNATELTALRDIFAALRHISADLTRIAEATAGDALSGQRDSRLAIATVEASEAVRQEMRRIVAVMTGHFEHWGVPGDMHREPHDPSQSTGAAPRPGTVVRRPRMGGAL